MAYEGPFSNRLLGNLVHIVEMGLNFSTTEEEANVEPIILDATIEFTKTFTAQVTTNPVGDKSDRADHYHLDPITINISGVVSNDSINVYEWARSFGGTARAQQYVERMQRLFETKRLVEIRMPDGLTTENCLITSLTISRDPQWSNGFKVDISAQQIQVLTGEITKKPNNAKKDKVTKTAKKGTQSTTDATLKKGSDGEIDIKQQETTTTVPPLANRGVANSVVSGVLDSTNIDILRSLYV